MPPSARGKKVDFEPIDSGQDDEQDEAESWKTKQLVTSIKAFGASRIQSITSGITAVVRPRGGELGSFMLMPVDILVEICRHLHPKDLRALSLTTHNLRSILMSRDAKHIWKSSLLGTPRLPECPPDINEPQFVRLLFSYECYACGTHCGLSNYYHRVLYCMNCFQTNMADYTYMYDFGDEGPDIRSLFTSEGTCSSYRHLAWHKSTFEMALLKYRRLRNSAPELRENFISDAKEAHRMRIQTADEIDMWKEDEDLRELQRMFAEG